MSKRLSTTTLEQINLLLAIAEAAQEYRHAVRYSQLPEDQEAAYHDLLEALEEWDGADATWFSGREESYSERLRREGGMVVAGKFKDTVTDETQSRRCRHGKLIRFEHCNACEIQGYCDCPDCSEETA